MRGGDSIPVRIILEDSIPQETHAEATEAALHELKDYIVKSGGRRPYSVSVGLEGEEFIVSVDVKKAEIVRIRRITGYLSDSINWQSSKLDELHDRVKHT